MVNTAYSVARLSGEKVSGVEGWDTRIQDIRRSAAGYLPLPAPGWPGWPAQQLIFSVK